MTDTLERRTFLKGIFGGVTAVGVVIAATPQEIEVFASPLARGDAMILGQPDPRPSAPGAGEFLYNAEGRVVAIVTEVQVRHDTIDFDTYDGVRHTRAGLMRWDLRARGIGPMHMTKAGLVMMGTDHP